MGAIMERVVDIFPAGRWPIAEAKDVVRLAYDDRMRRRRRYVGLQGSEFLLDLPEVRRLGDGDGLKLTSGAFIAVEALAEPLLQVTGNAAFLARISWHLGNRHVPIQILPGMIRMREEKTLADLLARLDATVWCVAAPFDPELGLGAHGHSHAEHD